MLYSQREESSQLRNTKELASASYSSWKNFFLYFRFHWHFSLKPLFFFLYASHSFYGTLYSFSFGPLRLSTFLVASLQAGLAQLVLSAIYILWKGMYLECFSDLAIYSWTVVNSYLYNSWEVLNEKGATDYFFALQHPALKKTIEVKWSIYRKTSHLSKHCLAFCPKAILRNLVLSVCLYTCGCTQGHFFFLR